MEKEKITERGLSTGEISGIVTSQTDEVKKILEDNDYTRPELDQLIEAEKSGKDRKTVKNFLKEKKENLKVEKDLEEAEGEIEELEEILGRLEKDQDLEMEEIGEEEDLDHEELIEILGMNVEDLKSYIEENKLDRKGLSKVLEGEKKIKDRKTVKEFLNRKIKNKKLEKDAKRTEEDLKELKEDVEDFEEDEELSGLSSQLLENTHNKEHEADRTKNETSEKDLEDEDEQDEAEEKDSSEEGSFERKKQISEGLEAEIGEEQLESMSLEDLEELKSEQERREKIISELSEEGLDEDDLENATTGDLEKLHNQVFRSEEGNQENNNEGSGKSKEEIKEEAEEDLQMLQGAGKGSDEEDKDEEDKKEEAQEKIENLKTSIKEKFSRKENEEDDDGSGINRSSVKEKLDSYRGLNERESAVKTAHIMKGYLEYRLNIEREMTYAELAENLPSDEYEDMEVLSNFFKQMQEDEYTQNIRVDSIEDILDASLNVVDQLEG